ncbi:MAG: hypothetical protein ACI8S6_005574 [Myxococcota bacterium]|jgi:hypothetical protein
MALVKIARGIAVNPESFKYIALETKQGSGKVVYAVMLKIDDNSEHWLDTFDNKADAIALVKTFAKAINEADG